MKVKDLLKALSACDPQADVVVDALYSHDAEKVVLFTSPDTPAAVLIADTDDYAAMYFDGCHAEVLYETYSHQS